MGYILHTFFNTLDRSRYGQSDESGIIDRSRYGKFKRSQKSRNIKDDNSESSTDSESSQVSEDSYRNN